MNAQDTLFVPFNKSNFVTYQLASLQNKLNAQASRILSKHSNLTLTEWRILLMVSVWDMDSMAAITRESGMDKGQVSRAVKSMADKGYMRTVNDKTDARALVLQVTEDGLRVKEDVLPRMSRRQERLMKSVTDEDRAAMERVINALEDASRIDDF
ncbi:MAG: MarR family transcriptional regulator [Pseudomonadota bacterium]